MVADKQVAEAECMYVRPTVAKKKSKRYTNSLWDKKSRGLLKKYSLFKCTAVYRSERE